MFADDESCCKGMNIYYGCLDCIREKYDDIKDTLRQHCCSHKQKYLDEDENIDSTTDIEEPSTANEDHYFAYFPTSHSCCKSNCSGKFVEATCLELSYSDPLWSRIVSPPRSENWHINPELIGGHVPDLPSAPHSENRIHSLCRHLSNSKAHFNSRAHLRFKTWFGKFARHHSSCDQRSEIKVRHDDILQNDYDDKFNLVVEWRENSSVNSDDSLSELDQSHEHVIGFSNDHRAEK